MWSCSRSARCIRSSEWGEVGSDPGVRPRSIRSHILPPPKTPARADTSPQSKGRPSATEMPANRPANVSIREHVRFTWRSDTAICRWRGQANAASGVRPRGQTPFAGRFALTRSVSSIGRSRAAGFQPPSRPGRALAARASRGRRLSGRSPAESRGSTAAESGT
jgi:hypothetical protein